MKAQVCWGRESGTKYTLRAADFLAQGGEGSVFVRKDLAFKIYHDAGNMPPVGKLEELRSLRLENVIAPIELLVRKSGEPVGFSMPRIENAQFLSRLFSTNFKRANGIAPEDVVNLVEQMRGTLAQIHREGFLIVDYNEMNLMLDENFSRVYHVDLDSCQTPGFPATALMESVRDRTATPGVFSEGTDWFSWGIVSFQLYTGIHPFKGRHPDFAPGDLDRRMVEGISVLDSAVRVPAACSDWSVIPAGQLEWYRRVFSNRDRCAPPATAGLRLTIPAAAPMPADSGTVRVRELRCYDRPVRDVAAIAGVLYVCTNASVFRDEVVYFELPRAAEQATVLPVNGAEPVVAVRSGDLVQFWSRVDGSSASAEAALIGEIKADAMFRANDALYTLRNGALTENSFERLGRTKHVTRLIANVHPLAAAVFPGMIVENFFGRLHILMPTAVGRCERVELPEIKGVRIVDAARVAGVAVLIAERGGRFDRIVIDFESASGRYDLVVEQDVDEREVQLTRGQNGIYLLLSGPGRVRMFYKLHESREIEDAPVDPMDCRLYSHGQQILVARDDRLYTMRSA